MLQQYLFILPAEASRAVAATLSAVAVLGVAFWLFGSRFSRYLTTLLAVGVGGTIGMQAPRWLEWNIDGSVLAIGFAVVLGVSGYALPGMWAGTLLGATLAAWSVLLTWICTSEGQAFYWPTVTAATTLSSYLQDLWHGLPVGMQRMAPFWAASAMVTGLACAILWTRLTTALAWSAAGVSMLLAGGVAWAKLVKPQWVSGAEPPPWVQIALVLLLTGIGTIIQLSLTAPRKKKTAQQTGKSARQHKSEPQFA